LDRTQILRIILLTGSAGVLTYSLPRILRRINDRIPGNRKDAFRASIGFDRLDGMTTLALNLSNESEQFVWVEEIDILLTELQAEQQTCEASCREVQRIRQIVRPDAAATISLSSTIYRAAGEPQRKYSFVLSSLIRCRIGEEWFEKGVENFRVRMVGLTASKVTRERKSIATLESQVQHRDEDAIAVGRK
jgi:hypothetical protein